MQLLALLHVLWFFLMPWSQVPVFCVLSLKVLLLKMPFADDAADEMVLLF